VRSDATLLEPLYLINDHDPSHYGIAAQHASTIHECRRRIKQAFPAWEDRLVEVRYDAVNDIIKGTLRRPDNATQTITDKIDYWLLHPVFGGLSVLLVLGLLFYLIFSIAKVPQDWIGNGFDAMGTWVQHHMSDGDLRNLIVTGVIAGVKGVLVFLPQIMILFFFIGIMEDTGYMSRIAFIVDRLMSKVGLNGKAFLPFLSSYACAVPGIMATRTIDSPKDRLITILIAPLASCSARLPVYGLLIPAMLPDKVASPLMKAGLMLSMYLLGTFGAFFFAWLFSKGVMRGASSPMILEMPSYKAPALKSVLLHVWERAMLFIKRAGTVILGLSILIWAAKTYPKTPGADPSVQLANSIAGHAGHFIEPVIKPLGYDWKIGIGLITSFAAREVFVSTMSIIYAVDEDTQDENELPNKLAAERWPDGRPVYTPLACLSLLVFYVFAMQCMSTLAVVRRETGSWKWPAFQLIYMTGTAYGLALLVYQIGKMFVA
jgi:ferrous iron transport protein B